MCGISGIVNLRGDPVVAAELAPMIAALAHRGPDAHGFFTLRDVGLAHARLSIIDLEGGKQPMSIEDGTLWITFNGEIFNYVELREELIKKGHKFATRSDTEVILHLYQEEGEDCVRHLNGQWAFAIWDERQQKLFLSRDRLGVRPLFYTRTDNRFLFASEVKALFAHPEVRRELDFRALSQILTFWVTVAPRTAFKNIWQVPPGHSLTFIGGEVRVWRYWDLEYCPENEDGQEGKTRLAEELLSLLLDATRIRLRSDVPVGAYLSGGLDSTLITALTRQLVGDRLRTFSVSFEDTEFDESEYQKEASTFLRTQHTGIRCSPGDIAAVFPDVVWHTEQPVVRTAPAPLFLLAKLVRQSGYKVVLTGEGADEMMGGYDIFKEAKIRRFWAKCPTSQSRALLLRRLYPYMENIQRQPSSYLRNFFHVKPEDLVSPYFSHMPRWELTAKLKMFLADDVRAEAESHSPLGDLDHVLPSSFKSWVPFSQAEYLEAMFLLPGYILSSQGDRMAMAHSVEGRYPFLDYRLVEFAAKLSPTLKMKVLDQKHLLKHAARGHIPDSIVNRHKQPYRAPEGKSFFLSSQPYVEELLSPERIRQDGVFDPEAVRALVMKFKNGRASSTKDNMTLVSVLSTQILVDQFVYRREQHTHSVQATGNLSAGPSQRYGAGRTVSAFTN
jgi:asparagine synthase (glutamine-hydrolysing)